VLLSLLRSLKPNPYFSVALLIILVCLLLVLGVVPGLPPNYAGKSACGGTLQAKIDAAAPGDTVVADACIYRETITISKPLTLKGVPGSQIRGSDVWAGKKWAKNGSYWTSKDTVPVFSVSGTCEADNIRCLWPAQVFVDGKPQTQVASDPEPGQFAINAQRQVILPIDPSKNYVEVTTRTQWVVGRSDDVTIEGFNMAHAANDAQTGALYNSGHSNWTLKNNLFSDAHGINIVLHHGTGLKLLNNEIRRGGQQGVGSYKAAIELRGNKIHDNGTEGFDSSWSAGGAKFAGLSSLVADSNEIYRNDGKGIGCDLSCENATISNDRIHHNTESAIFYEISDDAEIFGNVVWENGWKSVGGAWQGAIRATNTRDVEIYSNTLAWNQSGISVLSTDRQDSYLNDVRNNYVHDNTILSEDYPGAHDDLTICNRSLVLAFCQSYPGNLYAPYANNTGKDNRYWFEAAEGPLPRFSWNNQGYTKLSEFNATPAEEDGHYLSDAEKKQITTSKEIPAVPENHQ
jgi:hypothetical protein